VLLCLLIIFRHLIIIFFFIIVIAIIIIVGGRRSMRNAYTKGGQLGLSQQAVGVRDDWVDWVLGELNKRVIPLAVDDGLVLPKDVGAGLKSIHALVGTTTHGKDTPKHLQDAEVNTRGVRGTTTTGRVRRDYIWRGRGTSLDLNLGKSRTKGLMGDMLHKLLVGHHLDHAHDEGSESRRSERVDWDVSYLIGDVVKGVEVLILRDGIK
jgi:hypothetical protein